MLGQLSPSGDGSVFLSADCAPQHLSSTRGPENERVRVREFVFHVPRHWKSPALGVFFSTGSVVHADFRPRLPGTSLLRERLACGELVYAELSYFDTKASSYLPAFAEMRRLFATSGGDKKVSVFSRSYR